MSDKITTMLWFSDNAEEAANFYVSVFKDSGITEITRYPKSAESASGRPAGSVMTVDFELDGRKFTALNGGPHFKFNEAISLVVNCKNQKELDEIWNQLSAGGDPSAQQCGWLKDKFGLSWQIVPAELPKLVRKNPDAVMAAVLQMKKLDIAELEQAAAADTEHARVRR
jgi:predicted 3-demethylubiquinone-9 3-methyltransferase (glyoxalase superfamily)